MSFQIEIVYFICFHHTFIQKLSIILHQSRQLKQNSNYSLKYYRTYLKILLNTKKHREKTIFQEQKTKTSVYITQNIYCIIGVQCYFDDKYKMREGKPTFIRKLEQMLSDSKVEHIVHWDETGQRVCIQEPKLFEQEVLGEYFRHRRYSSFVRQLNIYGFRKVRKSTKQAHQFYHHFYNQHRMSTHELYPESALQLHDTIHDTPHDTPPNTPPVEIENPDPPNSSEGVEAEMMEEKPTISELLEQISGRIEEYKNEVQMDTLIGDEVERILNQPKYTRAKPYYSAVWESPSPLTACQLSTQLEFII